MKNNKKYNFNLSLEKKSIKLLIILQEIKFETINCKKLSSIVIVNQSSQRLVDQLTGCGIFSVDGRLRLRSLEK